MEKPLDVPASASKKKSRPSPTRHWEEIGHGDGSSSSDSLPQKRSHSSSFEGQTTAEAEEQFSLPALRKLYTKIRRRDTSDASNEPSDIEEDKNTVIDGREIDLQGLEAESDLQQSEKEVQKGIQLLGRREEFQNHELALGPLNEQNEEQYEQYMNSLIEHRKELVRYQEKRLALLDAIDKGIKNEGDLYHHSYEDKYWDLNVKMAEAGLHLPETFANEIDIIKRRIDTIKNYQELYQDFKEEHLPRFEEIQQEVNEKPRPEATLPLELKKRIDEQGKELNLNNDLVQYRYFKAQNEVAIDKLVQSIIVYKEHINSYGDGQEWPTDHQEVQNLIIDIYQNRKQRTPEQQNLLENSIITWNYKTNLLSRHQEYKKDINEAITQLEQKGVISSADLPLELQSKIQKKNDDLNLGFPPTTYTHFRQLAMQEKNVTLQQKEKNVQIEKDFQEKQRQGAHNITGEDRERAKTAQQEIQKNDQHLKDLDEYIGNINEALDYLHEDIENFSEHKDFLHKKRDEVDYFVNILDDAQKMHELSDIEWQQKLDYFHGDLRASIIAFRKEKIEAVIQSMVPEIESMAEHTGERSDRFIYDHHKVGIIERDDCVWQPPDKYQGDCAHKALVEISLLVDKNLRDIVHHRDGKEKMRSELAEDEKMRLDSAIDTIYQILPYQTRKAGTNTDKIREAAKSIGFSTHYIGKDKWKAQHFVTQMQEEANRTFKLPDQDEETPVFIIPIMSKLVNGAKLWHTMLMYKAPEDMAITDDEMVAHNQREIFTTRLSEIAEMCEGYIIIDGFEKPVP